jgi:hypothetical protein
MCDKRLSFTLIYQIVVMYTKHTVMHKVHGGYHGSKFERNEIWRAWDMSLYGQLGPGLQGQSPVQRPGAEPSAADNILKICREILLEKKTVFTGSFHAFN